MTSNIQLKIEAHRAWADFLERADSTRSLFQRAGLSVPEELKHLLGGSAASPPQTSIGNFRPPSPPNAGDDWIWIDISDATTTSLTLATLREVDKPLTAKEIRDKIITLGEKHEEVVVGTVYNAVQRMAANDVLNRGDDGRITIKQAEKTPLMHDGRLWGPVAAFQMAELAAHRRDAEVYLLRKTPVGLQQSQVVAMLRDGDLLNPLVPMNKDLIKGDFGVMDGKRVRRIGNSKKWEAI